MMFGIVLVLAFSTSALCATVGEFPFDTSTDAASTPVDEMFVNLTEFEDESDHLGTEGVTATERDQLWTSETSPIFQVIRDFLFQARDGLLEPMTEGPIDEKSEQIIRIIEHGLMEATTILKSQVESSTFPTVPLNKEDKSPPAFMKRKGEVAQEVIGTKTSKRQTAFDMVVNTSSFCSSCYDNLQMCVQKCFAQHNCNDIQRSVRTCPPTRSRLCNPFTPWNPVDECQSNVECRSPLLCCNDGCINKCVPGVWQS